MKKFFIPFCFVVIFIFYFNFSLNLQKNMCTFAQNCNFEIICDEKRYNFSLGSLHNEAEKKNIKKNYYSDNLDLKYKKKLLKKISKSGFSSQDALNYSFYGLKQKIEQIEKETKIQEKNCEVRYNKELAKFYKTKSSEGKMLDKKELYDKFFDAVMSDKKTIKIKSKRIYPKLTEKDFVLEQRGFFSTSFSNSSKERKKNIEIAVNKIAGTVIKPGEVFSFNRVTGQRDEKSGYLSAKIIVGGKFVDGVGGGVCQVSSTLYNAVLLSGLKVVESHPHSLKVGYVKEGFDAMVNFYSADFKFENNTSKNVYIGAKFENNSCGFYVFGEPNKQKIVPRSEVVSKLSAPDFEYVYDTEDLSLCGRLPVGEFKVVAQPKEGMIVWSYLDIYEKDKKLKTIKLRKSKYSSQAGKIVIGTSV